MNYIGLYTLVRREIERTFRVAIQVFVTPLLSAFLFIFIFGYVLGRQIELIAGIPYIEFVFPGILMMNIISAAFAHSSNSLYFGRFVRAIEEILVAPFSHIEMIIGFVIAAVGRTVVIAIGVMMIGLLFGAAHLAHPFLFLLYVVGAAIIFALLGILVGLWAKGFEQLNVLNTFVIMPLSFLGGIFYSVELLPQTIQKFTYGNPFFYFIDGMRYSMTGIHESNLWIGFGMIGVLILVFGILVERLFHIGWRLRE